MASVDRNHCTMPPVCSNIMHSNLCGIAISGVIMLGYSNCDTWLFFLAI